jgi:hypothetical protein
MQTEMIVLVLGNLTTMGSPKPVIFVLYGLLGAQ